MKRRNFFKAAVGAIAGAWATVTAKADYVLNDSEYEATWSDCEDWQAEQQRRPGPPMEPAKPCKCAVCRRARAGGESTR